jgi:hypothetical protein
MPHTCLTAVSMRWAIINISLLQHLSFCDHLDSRWFFRTGGWDEVGMGLGWLSVNCFCCLHSNSQSKPIWCASQAYFYSYELFLVVTQILWKKLRTDFHISSVLLVYIKWERSKKDNNKKNIIEKKEWDLDLSSI